MSCKAIRAAASEHEGLFHSLFYFMAQHVFRLECFIYNLTLILIALHSTTSALQQASSRVLHGIGCWNRCIKFTQEMPAPSIQTLHIMNLKRQIMQNEFVVPHKLQQTLVSHEHQREKASSQMLCLCLRASHHHGFISRVFILTILFVFKSFPNSFFGLNGRFPHSVALSPLRLACHRRSSFSLCLLEGASVFPV